MKKLIAAVLFLFFPVLVVAQNNKNTYDIYVINYAWHTGIVLKTSDVKNKISEKIPSFNEFNYVDIGWGDEDFYQTPGMPEWLALKAFFYPTSSVMELKFFNLSPKSAYGSDTKIVKFSLDEDNFRNLKKYIFKHFKLDKKGDLLPGRSVDKYNAFYLAKGIYYFGRTCNTWIAQALNAAGIDIRTFMVVTSSQLFDELYEYKLDN